MCTIENQVLNKIDNHIYTETTCLICKVMSVAIVTVLGIKSLCLRESIVSNYCLCFVAIVTVLEVQ